MIDQRLIALREYPARELDIEVRRALRDKTEDPTILEARALFVTGLRRQCLWPLQYRKKR